jgi:hypothetical protein
MAITIIAVETTNTNEAAIPVARGISPAFPKRLAMMIGIVCESRRVRKLVAPNSPSDIASEKARPVEIAGLRRGKSTAKKRLQGPAPKVAAADLRSFGIPSTTGVAERMTNGSAIAACTTGTSNHEERKSKGFESYVMRIAKPITTGDIANGKMIKDDRRE